MSNNLTRTLVFEFKDEVIEMQELKQWVNDLEKENVKAVEINGQFTWIK